MDLNIDLNLLLAIALSIVVLLILFRVLYYPLRCLFKLLFQTAGGVVVLLLFNFVASIWGFSVGLNLFTAMLVGVMGIPALIMLICLQLIL